MGRAKTLKKREVFSVEKLPEVSLKSGVKTSPHDPDKKLRSVEFISRALLQSLWENDLEAFKEIVKSHYEAVNIGRALKKAHLSARTFYEAISPKGNPSLKTVAKIFQGLRNI